MGDLLFLIGLVFFRLGGFKQKSQNLILSSLLLPVFGGGKTNIFCRLALPNLHDLSLGINTRAARAPNHAC